MKISLGGIKSRIDTIEKKINKLEDTAIGTIQTEVQKKERLKKNEQSFIKLCVNTEWSKICVIKVPERQGFEIIEKIFEVIMAKI